MSHVVLLGDSIFDNGAYVPGEPAVIEQVRQRIPAGDSATLLAVDGDVTADVSHQLAGLPADATHLFVSVGGNDALGQSHVLNADRGSVVAELTRVHEEFAVAYDAMLRAVRSRQRPTTVCTIYDAVPGLNREAVMGLSLFNDVILRTAFAHTLPVIDLRMVCGDARDFSTISRIEPSAGGGAKIADRIATVLRDHAFSSARTTVYS